MFVVYRHTRAGEICPRCLPGRAFGFLSSFSRSRTSFQLQTTTGQRGASAQRIQGKRLDVLPSRLFLINPSQEKEHMTDTKNEIQKEKNRLERLAFVKLYAEWVKKHNNIKWSKAQNEIIE